MIRTREIARQKIEKKGNKKKTFKLKNNLLTRLNLTKETRYTEGVTFGRFKMLVVYKRFKITLVEKKRSCLFRNTIKWCLYLLFISRRNTNEKPGCIFEVFLVSFRD